MTVEQVRYLSVQAEEYADRILLKSRLHSIGLRIESQAALTAALVCLHRALESDGDVGLFRTIVNECASEVADNAHAEGGPRRLS